MGRRPLHSEDAILDAARDLVLEGGARAASVNAIARASGAPKGSIYHRFASMDDLLAAMWIRAARRAQAGFVAAAERQDAVAAALSIHDFARRERADARLLAAMRREDLVERVADPRLRRDLAELNRPLGEAAARLARELFGADDRESVERTVCAVVDLPMGAIRRHLIAGTPIPRTARGQLEAAVRAALAAH
jgi:AcrR family transcriptional regulator